MSVTIICFDAVAVRRCSRQSPSPPSALSASASPHPICPCSSSVCPSLSLLFYCVCLSSFVAIHPFIHSLLFLSFIHSFINSSIHSFIHPFMYPSIHTSIHSYIHTFIHSYVHTFIHSYIHAFIHASIHSSIHSFIHSFIQAKIRSFLGISKWAPHVVYLRYEDLLDAETAELASFVLELHYHTLYCQWFRFTNQW